MCSPIIVSVEATIASGKSTLLKLVEDRMGDRVHVVQEPVGEWQHVLGDPRYNILDLFYKDKQRWSYAFQTYVWLTRAMAVAEAVEKLRAEGRLDSTVILVERSHHSDMDTFATILYEGGFISEMEWDMYCKWWSWMTAKAAPVFSGHVYLKASLDTVMHRLRKRNRGEECGVDASYQQLLINKHEVWLEKRRNEGVPLLILDAEVDFVTERADYNDIQDLLENYFAELRERSRVSAGGIEAGNEASCAQLTGFGCKGTHFCEDDTESNTVSS